MLTYHSSGGRFFPSGDNPCNKPTSMTLHDLKNSYVSERDASPRYRESLLRTVRKAAIYGIETVCQLTPEAVNQFLSSLPLSPTTRHNIRRELLTLWRYAHEEGWCSVPPLRVRRIKDKPAAPQAWAQTDLAKMLRCAEADETIINRRTGLMVRDVLPTWITLGFETGLRLHDMLDLTADNYRNGCIVVRAHKTGKVAVRRLSAECQRRLDALLSFSPDATVFRWTLPRRRAIATWRAFLDRNHMPGSSKWLRRSAATQLERLTPGAAAAWLDHSNPALARKHYLDQTLLDSTPMPPTAW